jgi:hypothetical protein
MTTALLGELTDVLNGLHTPNRVWQGKIQTQILEHPLLVQFNGTNETVLTPELEQCLKTFLEQQKEYKQLALSALLEYYRTQILPIWRENNYFGVPELAPNIQNLTEFEMLLTYPRLLLHNANSWGLEFECTWDVEHGTGVLFVDGQVVSVGLAEVAH